MTNSDEAIREIAEAEYPDIPGISERAPYNQIMATNRTNLIARLTALISEHYVAKEGVEKMASERLREELIKFCRICISAELIGDEIILVDQYLKSKKR